MLLCHLILWDEDLRENWKHRPGYSWLAEDCRQRLPTFGSQGMSHLGTVGMALAEDLTNRSSFSLMPSDRNEWPAVDNRQNLALRIHLPRQRLHRIYHCAFLVALSQTLRLGCKSYSFLSFTVHHGNVPLYPFFRVADVSVPMVVWCELNNPQLC